MKTNLKQTGLLLMALLWINIIQAQDELKQKINQLAKEYEQTNYHGVVLVARSNDILAKEAFGLANQKTWKKNTPSTLFKTESTGKMFTAVAVLQLVEAGKLELQKTIVDYLPESKIRNADKITLHHLLTHQSGLTSPWERPDFEFKKYTKEEWWNFIETNPLAFDEPGKGIYYSSSAFEVLAAIVEKVSGSDFKDYCQQKIFTPSGMKNTYYSMDTTSYFARGAKPYRWVGSQTCYEYPINHLEAGGAGGWLSCVEDFYHFGLALMNEKLISKKYLDLMMTGHVEMPPGKYGYGLEIYTDLMVPGKTVYGHNGGGMGFGCDLFFEPETQTIVATMLNMFGNSRFVTRNFMATTFGNEPQKPEKDKRQILFDMINEKGLDDFDAHYQEYFKTIGMEQPNPFFLISFADGYDLLGQSENRKKYLNTLKNMIPENAVLYIQLGDIEAKEKQNEIAKSYYTKARELAEKNEPMLLGEIETKLKSL